MCNKNKVLLRKKFLTLLSTFMASIVYYRIVLEKKWCHYGSTIETTLTNPIYQKQAYHTPLPVSPHVEANHIYFDLRAMTDLGVWDLDADKEYFFYPFV